MIVAETERLIIRHFELSDTDYILKQLNEPSFILNIADKNVRSSTDAKNYLINGPVASYNKVGFGLNMVIHKESGAKIGMCGLVTRDELDHPDLGYAFLPEFWGQGYALEASKAILDDAKARGLTSVLGVTLPENQPSNRLLIKLGFSWVGVIQLYGSDNNLYQLTL